ncbi:MAG TPA: tetratricopeptide repeat protein [Candidatus Polarisedimenticolia bacterium]
MTVLVYVPAAHGGFIWDDNHHVTQNAHLRDAAGLGHIWLGPGARVQYYPLTFTTFWIEYHLWGLNPAGYHLTNILLHGLSALLLWLVLRRLGVPGAWLAAALFAVHPVYVESVAWITERKNVLSGALYLAAALAYFRCLRLDESDSAKADTASFGEAGREIVSEMAPTRSRGWYVAALVLFSCTLLSKTVAGSLPAALLLVLWWKRGRIRWADVYPLVPFFILACALGLLTMSIEKHHVGARGDEWNLSAVQRCLIAGRALWFYAGKLAWPVNLTFIYPRWDIDAGSWRQFLYPGTALAVIGATWGGRHRLGRGPVAALLFFDGTLVPALGFFDVFPMRYSFVADHFQYLASLGLITLAAAGAAEIWRRLDHWGRNATSLLAACVLVVLGLQTWSRGYAYADLETLWRDTLRKNPAAEMAHNNLGNVLAGQGRLDEAVTCYGEALRLDPAFTDAHYNLGNALARQGKLDEALAHYAEALRLEPDSADSHNSLGIVLDLKGQHDEALAHYTEALRLKPAYPEAHNNLGLALAELGRLDEAVTHYTEALRLKPTFPDAYCNRGIAFFQARQLARAWSDVRMCRQLGGSPNPDLVRSLTEATRLPSPR